MGINPLLFEARTAGKRESEQGTGKQIAALAADIVLQLAAVARENREQSGAKAALRPAYSCGATKRGATGGAAASAGCEGVYSLVNGSARGPSRAAGLAFVCAARRQRRRRSVGARRPREPRAGAAPARTDPSPAPTRPEGTHRPRSRARGAAVSAIKRIKGI